MAIHYVDSAAAGANDGTSKTDAWTSLFSSIGGATSGGDEIWVSHTHDEVDTSTRLYDWSGGVASNPIAVKSVNFSDDSYTAGAVVRQTGGAAGNDYSVKGVVVIDGVSFHPNDDFQVQPDAGEVVTLRDMTITHLAVAAGDNNFNSANGDAAVVLEDVTLDKGSSTQSDISLSRASLFMRRMTFSGSPSGAMFVLGVGRPVVVIEDSDIVGFTSLMDNASQAFVTARRCKIPSGFNLVDAGEITNPTSLVVLEHCTSDADIAIPTFGLNGLRSYWGEILGDDGRYRTGGSDDGDNTYSWAMTTNSNAKERLAALVSPPMVRWVDGGSSLTFTVYIAGGASLDDEDFWIELAGPDDNATSTTQGHSINSRPDPQAAAAAIATDSGSTWNGTGVGTKQQVDLTYTPQIAGPVTIRCFLAKPSTTVYVDANIGVA